MPAKSRRSGGPKSELGKAKSAQNSLKHGLTTLTPTTPSEREMMTAFADELTNFYHPQTPLEKIQIERIALCRAKLHRLYAVEQARLEIETNKLAHSPNHFFEKMPQVKGLAKGMALEYIRFRQLTLPFGLSERELMEIVREVRDLQGRSVDEAGLWQSAPHLTQLIDRQAAQSHTNSKSSEATNTQAVSRLAHLENIVQALERIAHQGEDYMEYVKSIYAVYEKLQPPPEEEVSDELHELEEFIREQQAAHDAERAKRHPHRKKVHSIESDEEHQAKVSQKRLQGVIAKCHVFIHFYFDSQEAKRVYQQFMETRHLALQAVSLPAAEADLFLRYQTALERRLSSAIGELLELQRRR